MDIWRKKPLSEFVNIHTLNFVCNRKKNTPEHSLITVKKAVFTKFIWPLSHQGTENT